MLTAERVHVVDGDFLRYSKILDQYLNGDHRYSDEVRAHLWTEADDVMVSRPVPLVKALSMELTPQYVAPPVRVFSGEPADAQELRAVYASMEMDKLIGDIAARAIVQGTQLAVWMPVHARGARSWVVHALSPWECEVYPDPEAPAELERARVIRMRLPRETSAHWTQYDIAELAMPGIDLRDVQLCAAGRERVLSGRSAGVWASDGAPLYGPSGELPFGRYPVAMWRVGLPETGCFWGPQNRALLSAQVAVDLNMTSIELMARFSSGQLWMVTDGPKPVDMSMGPDRVLHMAGPNDKLYHTPRPFDAQSQSAAMNVYVDAYRLASGLRPSSYTGAAVTADAKLIELYMQGIQRRDIQPALVAGEQSMARAGAVAVGWRHGAGAAPLRVTGCRMRYNLPKPPRNPLQDAQGQEIRARLGVEAVWQTVQEEARERGEDLTRDQAQAVVRANRADWAESGLAVQGPNPSGT
jgi:hypothetical protein